jgi:hypothetical protein
MLSGRGPYQPSDDARVDHLGSASLSRILHQPDGSRTSPTRATAVETCPPGCAFRLNTQKRAPGGVSAWGPSVTVMRKELTKRPISIATTCLPFANPEVHEGGPRD